MSLFTAHLWNHPLLDIISSCPLPLFCPPFEPSTVMYNWLVSFTSVLPTYGSLNVMLNWLVSFTSVLPTYGSLTVMFNWLVSFTSVLPTYGSLTVMYNWLASFMYLCSAHLWNHPLLCIIGWCPLPSCKQYIYRSISTFKGTIALFF